MKMLVTITRQGTLPQGDGRMPVSDVWATWSNSVQSRTGSSAG